MAVSIVFRATLAAGALVTAAFAATAQTGDDACQTPRARDAGIAIGILTPGKDNAIIDVPGAAVGHAARIEGTRIHTGVTAIRPHSGNLFQDKVPAGIFVANGFGKFMGSTQVRELGQIETPILPNNTLSVPEAAAGSIEWTLRQPGNESVRSINAVVGETNDGMLNDIRGRHVTPAMALAAIENARAGPVAEGNVGAGAGTVAFGFKGGIGTSSCKLPANLGGYTVGVLVQSNYGGVLTIAGAPVGQMLGKSFLKDALSGGSADGSVIVWWRPTRRCRTARAGVAGSPALGDDRISPLFQAVAEATEEAVINSMFAARTVKGHPGTVPELPVEDVRAIIARMPRP